MKNIAKFTKITLILSLFMGWSFIALAQGPPPPPGGPTGGAHGSSQNQPMGGNAPIGGGLAILLGLGAVWSGRKVYLANKIKE